MYLEKNARAILYAFVLTVLFKALSFVKRLEADWAFGKVF